MSTAANVKPVLFVTGHAPPDRHGAFAALHEREGLELALFGGRHAHGAPAEGAPPVPHRHVEQREVAALAASGAYRAVVAGTGGRTALPAAWRGARRAGVPLLFWAAFWAHPRSAAHAASYPLMLRIYRGADAVVTYGEHVSAYVAAKGARNVHIAPQAVDNAFWSAAAAQREPGAAGAPERASGALNVLFVGRNERAKGLAMLLDAWSRADIAGTGARLDLVGDLAVGDHELPAAVHAHGRAEPERLRNFYAAADVVAIPSIPTRTFREPWGLVANEAMNQRAAIIATDAVGAAAGGLVRDGRNGIIVPAGDPGAFADALLRLSADRDLCTQLGAAAARDVVAYDYDAWATGFANALASVGASERSGTGSR
jgi:glycosyltransferase involved in cell wall biosynthesis